MCLSLGGTFPAVLFPETFPLKGLSCGLGRRERKPLWAQGVRHLDLGAFGSSSFQTLARDKEHSGAAKGPVSTSESGGRRPLSLAGHWMAGEVHHGHSSLAGWAGWAGCDLQEEQKAGKLPAASSCLTADCLISSFRLLWELSGAPGPFGHETWS